MSRTRGRPLADGAPPPSTCARAVAWAVALALVVLPPAAALAAPVEPVVVRAAIHPGFARLALEWPRAITVDGRQTGDRLTLRFARPFTADLAPVVDRLDGYLRGILRDGDDHEVTLRLAPGVAAEVDVYDERIVAVDLTRAAPPGGQPVALRTGSHDGFGRIVLDWGEPVGYETTTIGSRWRIVFDREADIDGQTIARRFDRLIAGASSARGDGRSELVLTLRNGVGAEAFEMAGERVVIDLHEPAGALAEAARRAEVEPAAAPGGQPGTPAPQLPATLAPASPAAAAAAWPAAATASPAPELTLQISGALERAGGVLDFAWNRAVPAAFLVRAGHLWAVFAPPDGQALAMPSLPSPLPGYLGPAEPVETPDGVALRFALRRPLAAAVEREDARWRVLLGTAPREPLPVSIARQEQPPRLRIDAGEPVHLVQVIDPEVGDRLVFWPLLAAGRGQPARQRLVDLDLLATAQGLAWQARNDDLRAAVSGHAVELIAGNGLTLSASAPAPAPRSGTDDDRSEPAELPVPVAVTAAVATPPTPADEAPQRARPGSGQATQQEPADGHLAADVQDEEPRPDRAGSSAPLQADGSAGTLGLARFALAVPTRSALQQRIAQAAPEERDIARLELARWFLSRAMAAEAMAVLEVLNGPQPEPGQAPLEPARHLLAGAAALLTDRLDDAAAVLEAPALDDDPEVALWRAALAAAREDWPRGARELARAQPILASYPLALQVRLGLPAVEAASEAGEHDLAGQVLDALAQPELNPLQRARLAFHQGLAQARRGSLDRADAIWRELEDGADSETRIEAAYARVQMLLGTGRLTADEALAKLAPARPLWRGHPWEARMLDGLAGLYRASGDHASAIRTWHDLLGAFPALADAGRIRALLDESFAAALGPGGALGAVRGYALYRDFPALMPGGPAGDQLRRSLAAQLAELDLLEPAAQLLGELLEQRVGAPARAEAGADLAELWLRAPDPTAALAALEHTAVAGDDLPPPLAARRRVLRARALAADDRPDEALALLEGRESRSERLERSAILWQIRDWRRLAAALESLLGRRTEPAAALSAADQDLVLRLAVAYAQQTDGAALERLRARFGPAMRGEAGEPAFLMATMAPGRTVAPEAVLAVAAEHLAQVQSYLDAASAAR